MVSKKELVPKYKLWCQSKKSRCIQNTTALGVEASFFGSAAASTLTGKLISCRWLFLGCQQKPLVDNSGYISRFQKSQDSQGASHSLSVSEFRILQIPKQNVQGKEECGRDAINTVETPKLCEVLTRLSPKASV